MPEILEAEKARELIEAQALGREIATVHAPDAWFLKRGLDARRGRGRAARPPVHRRPPARQAPAARHRRRRADARAAPRDERPRRHRRRGRGRSAALRGERRQPGVAALRRDVRRRRLAVPARPAPARRRRSSTRTRSGSASTRSRSASPASGARSRASRAPIKAVLMDQARIAGLGNLLTDEALFRAGIDPARPANTLSDDETRTLARSISNDASGAPAPRRLAHRRPHAGAGARRPLPAGRRRAPAPHRRRPHHLLLPGPPASRRRGADGQRFGECLAPIAVVVQGCTFHVLRLRHSRSYLAHGVLSRPCASAPRSARGFSRPEALTAPRTRTQEHR